MTDDDDAEITLIAPDAAHFARAAQIDPEAWSQPLDPALSERRADSLRRAFAGE